MRYLPIYAIMLVLMVATAAAGPVLSTIQNAQVNEGESVTVPVTLADASDNGTTTFLVDGSQETTIGPHAVNITKVDNQNADIVFESGLVSADTSYTLNVSASDGNSSDWTEATVEVTNAPAGPVMPSISDKTVNENDQVSFTVTLQQGPDNGSTVWSLTDTSVGSLSAKTDTQATFSMNASFVSSDTTYDQTITASDNDSSDNASFTITVRNTGNGVSISAIDFGGDDQERSNTELDDDEDDYEINTSSTFTVTNNEAVAKDIEVSWSTASKYKVVFEDTVPSKTVTDNGDAIIIQDVSPGESVDVRLNARVPEDLDSFFGDLDDLDNQEKVNIGTLTAQAQNVATVTSNMFMQAENMLEIDELTITIDGDDDEYDDGDTVEEISPGVEIEIELRARNDYSSSDELDMEDVEFAIFADDGDLEVEEDEEIDDISPRDEETATLSFTLDDDIDEDTYDVVITLQGEDENGARHGEQYELEFEVEREDELIEIKRATLDRSEVTLCDFDSRRVNLDVEIENEGQDDSDEVALVVRNDELDIDERRLNLDLDEGDDYENTYSFTIPENTRTGTYFINVLTYFDFDDYDDDDASERELVTLRVNECPDSGQDGQDDQDDGDGTDGQDGQDGQDDQDDEEVVVITPPEQNQTEGDVVAVPVKEKEEQPDFLYLGLLGLGYLVVIVLILVLLVRLFSRK